MRMLTFAALLALASPALAASPPHFQLRNAADLVRVCSTESSDEHFTTASGFCHGVLVGAYSFYSAATAKADRYICPTNPPPSRATVMNGFVAWAKAHTQHYDAPAVDTLFRYLGGAYPCKK